MYRSLELESCENASDANSRDFFYGYGMECVMRYEGLKRKIRISVGDEAILKNTPQRATENSLRCAVCILQ